MLKLTILGHLGKDAVVNTVSGKTVINFSAAHSEKQKDGQAKTTWVECAYWTEKTAIATYLKKGTQVYVEGNGELKEYAKKDGTSGSNITCRVANIQLLGGKEEGQQQAAPIATNNGGNRQVQQSASLSDIDDSLPF